MGEDNWRQESGDIDERLLIDKIKRESSLLFYRLLAGQQFPVPEDDVAITVWKTMPFKG